MNVIYVPRVISVIPNQMHPYLRRHIRSPSKHLARTTTLAFSALARNPALIYIHRVG